MARTLHVALLTMLFLPLIASPQMTPQPNLALPGVPREIMPPAGQTAVFKAHAQGFQVYKCTADKGAAAWTLVGPDAQLFGSEPPAIGTHYAVQGAAGTSPAWKLNDGSEVVASKSAAVDAPDGKGVPWLLLKVTSNSHRGILADVTAVQRVNTNGGKAPAGGCTEAANGTTTQVPYTADYYFSK